MSQFHSLTITQIRPLTPNAVAVSFGIPAALKETFSFTPGQYITLKWSRGGKELRRSYSISSVPGKDHFTIGIKKVGQEGFSSYANSKLKVGDTLEVMPPEGRFTFADPGKPVTLAAFAAGSGITPIIGMVRSVLAAGPKNRFVLVYGNRSYEEAMFYTDLVKLQLENPERFHLYFINSQSREDDALFGRIDSSIVNYVVKNKHKDTLFDAFYLCGPEAMIHTVTDTLTEHGIPESNIRFELFTSTDIQEEMPVTADGQTQVTVMLDEEEYQLTMDKKRRVLDAVLEADIDAPYSCQGGICSSCIARITEGKAEMVKNQILTDGEIEEGLILTCQAVPLTPTLKVDYDDV